MFETHFYHKTIRKYTAVFGTIFNDFKILRSDGNTFKVPLSYGLGLHHIRKKNENNSLDGIKRGLTLPRMSFVLTGIQKDLTRQTNRLNRFVRSDGAYQYNAVPYDFYYKVVFRSKNLDDSLQVAEQLLPAFSPDISITVDDNSDMDIHTDVKVVMTSATPPGDYDGEVGGEQIYEWTFEFTLKGYLYQQTKNGTLIKDVTVSISDAYVDKLLTDINWKVDPITANEDEPHTLVNTITEY